MTDRLRDRLMELNKDDDTGMAQSLIDILDACDQHLLIGGAGYNAAIIRSRIYVDLGIE